MPWKEWSVMSLRWEFVRLACEPGANISALARQFGISRTCAYKWLERYRQSGKAGLEDRSRRPHISPRSTSWDEEMAILIVRTEHPDWGGRKIRAFLVNHGQTSVPSASTITQILRRHGCLDEAECLKHKPHVRFEREQPNELWQMDFKGYFLGGGGKVHPLDVLDDHSRYCLCLRASTDQKTGTVRVALEDTFRENGLPESILCDNGSPWGDERKTPHTRIGVWLMRLGVKVIHGRPYHPQTQGKLERFHLTLDREAIRGYCLESWEWQAHFDRFRWMYNTERPHEALGDQPPATRYRPSERVFPEALPPVVYDEGNIVRMVDEKGIFHWRGLRWRLSKAFVRQPIALRPSETDGYYDIIYAAFKVASVDLRTPGKTVNHVSERL